MISGGDVPRSSAERALGLCSNRGRRSGSPPWGKARRPVQRAARYDGAFPIEIGPDDLSRIVEDVHDARGSLESFDIAVLAHPGIPLADYEDRGATRAMHALWHTQSPAKSCELSPRPPSTQNRSRGVSRTWPATP